MNLKRACTILKPDQSRVLLRSLIPGDSQRIGRIVSRVMSIPEEHVSPVFDEVCTEFSQRHHELRERFLKRFEQIRDLAPGHEISEQRRLLIGSYFLAEYSLESAALFNPSIVPHPDQTGVPRGALRFVLSLRATGEGHISSITFRTGTIHADNRIDVADPAGFLTEPSQIPNPVYEKALFTRKLVEVGLKGEFTGQVMNRLGESFALEELRRSLDAEAGQWFPDGEASGHQEAAQGIWMVARSNFEVQFEPEQQLSQRILFPATPSQSNGIEDARFVCFQKEDGMRVYYATFTAFNGRLIVPELVETSDFLRFRFTTLNGPSAENKGMALFPRKVNDRYAMISRQDNENIFLMFSGNVHFWNEHMAILKPAFPWELVQLGNCGSPIETDAGWLVLSHGVGPMRKYCIGAFLLDRNDPSKVIGRMREPLLKPNENEREGYVPNVVYSCGALVHNGVLIIPYALADHATTFATVPLHEVLAAMHSEN
jgi:predicted GH43/DUF377 family glycosyl hydrolase